MILHWVLGTGIFRCKRRKKKNESESQGRHGMNYAKAELYFKLELHLFLLENSKLLSHKVMTLTINWWIQECFQISSEHCMQLLFDITHFKRLMP